MSPMGSLFQYLSALQSPARAEGMAHWWQAFLVAAAETAAAPGVDDFAYLLPSYFEYMQECCEDLQRDVSWGALLA